MILIFGATLSWLAWLVVVSLAGIVIVKIDDLLS